MIAVVAIIQSQIYQLIGAGGGWAGLVGVAATREPLALHPRPWPLLKKGCSAPIAASPSQGGNPPPKLEASEGPLAKAHENPTLPRPRWSITQPAHQQFRSG